MTRTIFLIASSLLLGVSLSACCEASDNGEGSQQTSEQMQMHDGHDHDSMQDAMSADTDHGAGKIVEIDSEGGRVKLDHGPLENIGMDAMEMFFGVAGDVDLTDYQVGDDVAFMVKLGRNGSYRIMAMCDTQKAGADCLGEMMGHDGH